MCLKSSSSVRGFKGSFRDLGRRNVKGETEWKLSFNAKLDVENSAQGSAVVGEMKFNENWRLELNIESQDEVV